MKAKIKKLAEFVLIASLVMIALIIAKADAQSITGGITAGVSTGSVKISEIPGSFSNVIKGNNILGVNAGVFAKVDLLPVYIKPQLLINYRHGMVAIYQNETISEQENFTMEKLEIPLLIGLKIIGPVSIEAGPVYNYVLHSTDNFGGTDVTLKKSGLGFRAGAGVDLGRLNLFVNYQGIANKSSGSADVSTYQSPGELIFGIGLGLGNGH